MGSAFRRRLLWQFALVCLLSFPIVSWGQVDQPHSAQPRITQAPRIIQAIDESIVTRLQGNTHPLARPQFDRGAAPANLPMDRMLLVLRRSPEQESALTKLLDEQQDKSSPNYHKWLMPEEFGQKFGPAHQDIQAVTSWLQSHGFQVAKVAKGRTVVEFSGTAAQVQEAFHTAIHKYLVKGEEHWANANDLQIPTALVPVVAGVHTLHNFHKKPRLVLTGQKIKVPYTPGSPPNVTFPPQNGQPAIHALGPADYATIYNINPVYSSGINGAGTTIAVVARSNLFNGWQDPSSFRKLFQAVGIGFLNTVFDGPDPGDLGGGEEVEATLDVTWSTALAPGANIDIVISASTDTTDGADLSELYIIDNNLANVMTESFGDCEQHFTTTQLDTIASLAEQAAAQGITYIVASGDSGSAGCDDPNLETVATGPLGVNALAATPFTVAVGGTMFNEHGSDSTYWNTTNAQGTGQSAKSYIPENVWNESCTTAQCGPGANIFAGGGGASTFFPKPSWQTGVLGIPADSKRDMPDVSLTASGHDFYLICLEGSCEPDPQGFVVLYGVAGTSASTPAFAAVMALVNQKMANPSNPTGRQGPANYVLYRLAANENLSQCNASSTSLPPLSNCIFNDVTMGNNVVPGQSAQNYLSAPGYDLATGLGSVNVANLVNNWNMPISTGTTTSLSLNNGKAVTITHGASVPVQIQVTPMSGSAAPSGDVALGATLPSSQQQGVGVFTLNSAGSVSSSTQLLPGGSYNVAAHYSGNGNFLPSDSNAAPVTVNPEPSTTAINAETLDQNFKFQTFTTGPYGSFVYLVADVTGSSGQGIPTGSVNFVDAGANGNLGLFPLNSQGNTATPNFVNSPVGGSPSGLFSLAVGSHSLTASYLGDNSFNSSASSPLNLSITPAATTTNVTSAGAPQGATLTATVGTNSGGNAPSGTVTFSINGNPVGTPVSISVSVPATTNRMTGALLGVQGIASFTDTTLANGQYALSATYSGDTNYIGSSSVATPITVRPDFVLSANATVVAVSSAGGSGSLMLTIGFNDGFNGTVQFSCAGLPAESTCNFSPATIASSGTITLNVTTSGPHQVASLKLGSTHAWMASSVILFGAILLIGLPQRRYRWTSLLTLVMLAFLLAIVGCGGGNATPPPPPRTDPGTPAGTSNVIVTAASGSLSHSVSFTLIVP